MIALCQGQPYGDKDETVIAQRLDGMPLSMAALPIQS